MEFPHKIRWRLGELPSTLHRVGLGGLAVLLEWLKSQGRAPSYRIQLGTLSLELKQLTVQALLAEVYEGADVTRYSTGKPRGKEAEKVEHRGEKVYRYQDLRPAARWRDKSADAELWRDGIWSTWRKNPATRRVYSSSVESLSESLLKAVLAEDVVTPPSCLYPWAAHKDQGVSLTDLASHSFLLHFAPLLGRAYRCQDDWIWVYPEPRYLKGLQLGHRRLTSSRDALNSAQLEEFSQVGSLLEAAYVTGQEFGEEGALEGFYGLRFQTQNQRTSVVEAGHFAPTFVKAPPLEPGPLRALVLNNLSEGRAIWSGAWRFAWSELTQLAGPSQRLLGHKSFVPTWAAVLRKSLRSELVHRLGGTVEGCDWNKYRRGRGSKAARAQFFENWTQKGAELLGELRKIRTEAQLQSQLLALAQTHTRAVRGYEETFSELAEGAQPWTDLRDFLCLAVLAEVALESPNP